MRRESVGVEGRLDLGSANFVRMRNRVIFFFVEWNGVLRRPSSPLLPPLLLPFFRPHFFSPHPHNSIYPKDGIVNRTSRSKVRQAAGYAPFYPLTASHLPFLTSPPASVHSMAQTPFNAAS